LFIAERLHGGLVRINAARGLRILFDQPIIAAAENFLEQLG
jgi:hypothetical protein